MGTRGLRILEVETGSAAEASGLEPGDQILSANGREISDELALKFYLSEEYVDLLVRQKSGRRKRFHLDLSDHAGLGVKVEEFKTRICNNACLFCFVDQLPPGARRSLRVKDDDYRLSFLHGNYVTLTNLNERDLNRIIEQHLSPLYVSVHATDPELRARILGRKKPDGLNKKLRTLVRGGIRIHAQIVLMPGINDGAQLEKTIFDLYRLYPGVQSVAIVPLGLSDHGRPKDRLAPVTPVYSREVIRQAAAWRDRFRTAIGHTFAYLADEFYIQAGTAIPEAAYYDDFVQIEDGVGMVREFLDEFEKELRRRRKSRSGLKGTLATGRLFFPALQGCMERFNRKFGSCLHVCKVENRFMGRKVSVAGLLAGRDILTALSGRDLGDFVIIPGEALSREDGVFVDNLTPGDLANKLDRPVYSGGHTVRSFFKLLFEKL
jgi:putative radical SAM enzyme (TIGR03279 family)